MNLTRQLDKQLNLECRRWGGRVVGNLGEENSGPNDPPSSDFVESLAFLIQPSPLLLHLCPLSSLAPCCPPSSTWMSLSRRQETLALSTMEDSLLLDQGVQQSLGPLRALPVCPEYQVQNWKIL